MRFIKAKEAKFLRNKKWQSPIKKNDPFAAASTPAADPFGESKPFDDADPFGGGGAAENKNADPFGGDGQSHVDSDASLYSVWLRLSKPLFDLGS